MTTGTRTSDQRVGPYGSGTYYYRSWSGTDYPASRPSVPNSSASLSSERPFLRKVWRRAPRRSYVTNHPYSMQLEEFNNTLFTSGPYVGKTPMFVWGLGGAPIGRYDYDTWDANMDLRLLSDLREKCAGSDFNAGVFLGEGHQTLRLIGDSALKLARAIKHIKRGNLRAASVVLTGHPTSPKGKVASNWLELQYGWLPLLSDVHSGALFLAHHLNTPLQVTVRARKKIVRSCWETNYYENLPDHSYSHSRGQIKAILREKDVAQLSGLLDPLAVAWELVPFSFVVDWFIPIGEYLSARGLPSALTGTFVKTRTYSFGAEGYSRYYKAPGYRYKRVTLTRSVSTTLDIPLPALKPLGKVASWQHAANAVALLVQGR